MTPTQTRRLAEKQARRRRSGLPRSVDRVAPAQAFITQDDLFWFNEGTHYRLYEKLGAHLTFEGEGESVRAGVHFAVWAPDSEAVTVMGSFNGWSRSETPLQPRGSSGIWEGFVPGLREGELYKYFLRSRHGGYEIEKSDPFGFAHELPPKTASVVWNLEYDWGDSEWMRTRSERNALSAPISVYEVHLGSWMRDERDGLSLSYRDLAPRLASYVQEMGFTHVEFLPVMEHPFYGSWGYQVTGYFAPTRRYGTPQDFMFLVDHLHQSGIGVILDWVPSHFPDDPHGLHYFDGTHLFEHADPKKGFHPDWRSLIFNYGRDEVRSVLISSALFWLDKYHVDGLRVDAVASMLYLDYSRKEGEWIPNEYGGRENLEAIRFLRQMNEAVYRHYPDVQTIAEESTAWPMVSRLTYLGGLGFGMKWDMGWMHDTLRYFSKDPVYRRHHHNDLTFRMVYAFNENFMLSLSHDEVVHGKGSLLGKMPGDEWQKFANLRLLFGNMFLQPGKKLMFMGDEFGQPAEWNHDAGLDWQASKGGYSTGLRRWVRDLNQLYRAEPVLHQTDFDGRLFEWIDCTDAEQSVISFLRSSSDCQEVLVAVFNGTPVPRHNYRVGVPFGGIWREKLNSDASVYGGGGLGNLGGLEASPLPSHGRMYSLNMTIPPLGMVVFKWEGSGAEKS